MTAETEKRSVPLVANPATTSDDDRLRFAPIPRPSRGRNRSWLFVNMWIAP
jgi:hypothetical protein